MDFNMSDRQKEWLGRVQSFMHKHVRPAVPVYKQQDAEGERWKVIPVLEDLKKKARAEGLWNMFMPPSAHEDDEFRGAGLTNLEYAPLAEEMGHIGWASEVFNCSAPDTGNMEVLMRYGTKEHKKKWLRPLMDGEIRSAFLMTEPAVASSDATNIETRIERDGDHSTLRPGEDGRYASHLTCIFGGRDRWGPVRRSTASTRRWCHDPASDSCRTDSLTIHSRKVPVFVLTRAVRSVHRFGVWAEIRSSLTNRMSEKTRVSGCPRRSFRLMPDAPTRRLT